MRNSIITVADINCITALRQKAKVEMEDARNTDYYWLRVCRFFQVEAKWEAMLDNYMWG